MSFRISRQSPTHWHCLFLGGRKRRLVAWIKQSPGCKELKTASGTAFELPATMSTLDYLKSASENSISIQWDQDAHFQKATLELGTEVRNQFAKIVAAFKETGELPEDFETVDLRKGQSLSKYQQIGAYVSSHLEGYGLFFEQGTGKTATTIGAIIHRINRGEVKNVVIVCPNAVRLNWAEELERFLPEEIDKHVCIVKGDRIKRQEILLHAVGSGKDVNFIIVGVDTAVKTIDVLEAIKPSVLVMDESHLIRNDTTNRCRTLWRLRDVSEFRMALTGTPIGNGPFDLYAQIEFLEESGSGFLNKTSFKRFFGVFDRGQTESGSSFERIVSYQNTPVLKELLARYAMIITKREALPHMPRKMFSLREVEMTNTQKDLYRQVSEELVAELESMQDGPNQQLIITNMLTRMLRLAQICSGYVSWDPVVDPQTFEELTPRTVEDIPGGNPKIDSLLEYVDEEVGFREKMIVWASFTRDITTVADALRGKYGTESTMEYRGATKHAERAHAVQRFNGDRKCRFLVANAGAAGTGLNLLGYNPVECERLCKIHGFQGVNAATFEDLETCEIMHDYFTERGAENEWEDVALWNATHSLYFSSNWSATERSQSEDRNNRRGCRLPTSVVDLVVPDTVDQLIRERVRSKITTAQSITDLQDILQGFLHVMS